jgi:hypothetical protein
VAKMLSDAQVRAFIEDGYARIDGAFPREIADKGRSRILQTIGCAPDNPATWTRPVVRIGTVNDEHGAQPLSFREAANTLALYDAFDTLVGGGDGDPAPMWARSSYASPPRPTRATLGGTLTSASPAKPAIPPAATTRHGA